MTAPAEEAPELDVAFFCAPESYLFRVPPTAVVITAEPVAATTSGVYRLIRETTCPRCHVTHSALVPWVTVKPLLDGGARVAALAVRSTS